MTAGRLVLLLALAAAPARAQLRELKVVAYGPERGLGGQPVTALAQDRLGRLWVGTWGGGALRYDGLTWLELTSRDGLLSDRVLALVPGSRGEMWIATEGGLSIAQGRGLLPPVEGASWEVTGGLEAGDGTVWLALRRGGLARYKAGVLAPLPGLEGVRVTRLVEAEGALWLLGRPVAGDVLSPGSLHRFDGTSFHALSSSDGLPRVPLHDLFLDRQGRLWLGAESGLYRLSGARFELARFGGRPVPAAVRAISEDVAGRLWLGSEGAVLEVEGDELRELRLPPAIGPVPVLAAVASPAGGVFAATSGHLLRLEGLTAEVLPLEAAAPSLAARDSEQALAAEAALDDVLLGRSPLLVDREGGVWAVDGRRIVRYQGDEARRFGRGEGLPDEDVRALHVDGRGRLWVGTAQGVARFDDDAGHLEAVAGVREAVTALFSDRGDAVYAATASGVLRIDGLEARPWAPAAGAGPVTALALDGDGRLWIAGARGVARVTADGLEWLGVAQGLVPAREVESDPAPPAPVLCLRLVDGELWAGQDGGLARFTGTRFEAVPALSGKRVLDLLATGDSLPPRLLAVTPSGLLAVPGGPRDSGSGSATPVAPSIARSRLTAAHRSPDGALWLGLDLGLLEHNLGAETLHSGGGFPGEPVRAIVEDGGGRIWFATGRGLYRHSRRNGAPSVWIEQAVVGGVATSVSASPLVADGRCRGVSVRYSGVSFIGSRDAADLRFETRLLPSTPAWGAPGGERQADLGELKAGAYTFEVRAVSRDLVRSEPARLAITVGRPDEQPAPPRLELPAIARP